MLLRLLRRLAKALPEPDGVRHLKRLAEQLNEKAARFRVVAGRGAMLERRIEILEVDSRAWEMRARLVQGDLVADVARVCGRIEGQLQETRADLVILRQEENHLRALLTSGRQGFLSALELARELGHDVSDCLLYIDLASPDAPADDALLADDDRAFLARIIDSRVVH